MEAANTRPWQAAAPGAQRRWATAAVLLGLVSPPRPKWPPGAPRGGRARRQQLLQLAVSFLGEPLL